MGARDISGGHVLWVNLDYERVCIAVGCHEPDGAACRVMCAAGTCETYSYPEHECGLKPAGGCNAETFMGCRSRCPGTVICTSGVQFMTKVAEKPLTRDEITHRVLALCAAGEIRRSLLLVPHGVNYAIFLRRERVIGDSFWALAFTLTILGHAGLIGWYGDFAYETGLGEETLRQWDLELLNGGKRRVNRG